MGEGEGDVREREGEGERRGGGGRECIIHQWQLIKTKSLFAGMQNFQPPLYSSVNINYYAQAAVNKCKCTLYVQCKYCL